MLILLRKAGEEIVIGGEVVIGVARVARNRVYLTIEAPASVRVDRREIRSAKNRERRGAGVSEAVGRKTRLGETGQS